MAKKIFSVLLCICLMISLFCGCTPSEKQQTADKLKIVTTIFPPYDFARAVTQGKAELTMLLKPGTESHSYEPSPADILKVESCDIFIYNGGESDTWVEAILESIDTKDIRILKMLDCVDALEEEKVEGMHVVHSHEHAHHEETEFHPEDAEYDEHVWTSPENAIIITEAIARLSAKEDEENREFYLQNADAYCKELENLSKVFAEIAHNGSKNMMIFGDRFPFRYFAEEYGLSYRAAFPGCSAEAEPGAKTVAYLIDKVRKENLTHVFYIEFSNQKIAKTIQEETGAIPILFHSCHNLTATEMEQGVTYLELMRQNAENLKEALM